MEQQRSSVTWSTHFRLGWRSVREVMTLAPMWFVIYLVLSTGRALFPGAQVIAIRTLTLALEQHQPARAVVMLVAVVALLVGMDAVMGDISGVSGSIAIRRFSTEAKSRIGEAMARLTPEELADPQVATQSRAARESVEAALNWYPRNFISALQGLVSVGFLLFALWPLSPIAALLLVAALLVSLPFFAKLSKLEEASWPQQSEQNKFANYYTDQLVYQRTAVELISLGSADRVAGLARARYLASYRLFATMMSGSMLWSVASGASTAVLSGAALAIVALNPTATVAAAAAGVVAVLSGSGAMFNAGIGLGSWVGQSGPVRDFYAFIDARQGVVRELISSDAQMLEIRDVSYAYPGQNEPAVEHAGLELRKGEMVAFVGLNGAGKTTLVNCIAGLYRPSSGEVLIDGIAVSSLTEGQRLGAISMLTQEFGRYELTVRDAIGLGRPDGIATDEELWAALKAARADDFIRAFPQGLDTQLGQQFDGVGLSGGQWQRMALARIALRDAPIWLLDEPTSAVDAVTEQEIFDDLASTKADRITIVVSHRASTLRSMDRIYVLAQGNIVEHGTFTDLMASGGEFSRMFSAQVTAH